MKRVLKWLAVIVAVVAASGFVAFLYFIPPFNAVSPEDYVKQAAAPAPPLDHIADPGERAMAERGKYIVMTTGCADCHTTPGPAGPNPEMYLAGGLKLGMKGHGAAVSRNLTADPDTGLGAVKDEDLRRVFRSGVFRNGRRFKHRQMPWNAFANWTEEDRHAVITYLRHVKPIVHSIPDPMLDAAFENADFVEFFFSGNYANEGQAAK
jgi:hypothetical protein